MLRDRSCSSYSSEDKLSEDDALVGAGVDLVTYKQKERKREREREREHEHTCAIVHA